MTCYGLLPTQIMAIHATSDDHDHTPEKRTNFDFQNFTVLNEGSRRSLVSFHDMRPRFKPQVRYLQQNEMKKDIYWATSSQQISVKKNSQRK